MAKSNRIPDPCCDVAPFNPGCDVKAWCGPLRLDTGCLMPLLDDISVAKTNAAGADVELYLLDIAASKVDPLYSEAKERHFRGPYRMRMTFLYPDSEPEATVEAGFNNNWPTSATVPRATIESLGIRAPREGDVIRALNLPFHNERAVDFDGTTGAMFAFNITKSEYEGTVFQTPDFVGFSMNLARDDSFAPERRMDVVSSP